MKQMKANKAMNDTREDEILCPPPVIKEYSQLAKCCFSQGMDLNKIRFIAPPAPKKKPMKFKHLNLLQQSPKAFTKEYEDIIRRMPLKKKKSFHLKHIFNSR